MLEAIRVLDLSRVLPGHYASLILADLGAQVIKIEDPKNVDYLRSYEARINLESSFFLALNRNKQSIRLDLKNAKGQGVFMRLAAQCDIIIENFRPGVVGALGIDYEQVRKVNPGIIYCSISGFGQNGLYRDRGGHDLNFVSMSGILNGNRDGEGRPVLPEVSLGGMTGGMYGALAILGALVQKQTTGQGCYLDTAVVDGMLTWVDIAQSKLPREGTGEWAGESMDAGKAKGRQELICNNIYRTQDGRYVSVAALEPKFWQNFCRAVGREDLLPHHRSPAKGDNPAYRQMQDLFQQATLAEWQVRLSRVDCCFAPVLTGKEALESEYLRSRELQVNLSHPTEGLLKQLTFPAKVYQPGEPARSLRNNPHQPPPCWGEHTDQVLEEFGLTRGEIIELKGSGVLG